MQNDFMKELRGVNLESLPVGLKLVIRFPGIDTSIKFETNEPNHNLEDTIYNAIRAAVEQSVGIFESITLQNLALSVYYSYETQQTSYQLSDSEKRQYLHAVDPNCMLRSNAFTRFLAMVASRYYVHEETKS